MQPRIPLASHRPHRPLPGHRRARLGRHDAGDQGLVRQPREALLQSAELDLRSGLVDALRPHGLFGQRRMDRPPGPSDVLHHPSGQLALVPALLRDASPGPRADRYPRLPHPARHLDPPTLAAASHLRPAPDSPPALGQLRHRAQREHLVVEQIRRPRNPGPS